MPAQDAIFFAAQALLKHNDDKTEVVLIGNSKSLAKITFF